MKNVILIHKEPDLECFEVLIRFLVEDTKLKKFKIDEDALVKNMSDEVVKKFLKFLGIQKQQRDFILQLNKSGALIIEFEEELTFSSEFF